MFGRLAGKGEEQRSKLAWSSHLRITVALEEAKVSVPSFLYFDNLTVNRAAWKIFISVILSLPFRFNVSVY